MKEDPGQSDEMSALLRATDWEKTPLGPMASWPRSLANYVAMVLELPIPAVIFWGPEQTQIYNSGYARIMGPRHPRYFGASYRECWPDTYSLIYPWMRRVLDHGEVTRVENEPIMLTRHGFNEEAYFTFTFSALRDDAGEISGILQPVLEVTDAVLGARRAETLRALSPRADSTDPCRDAITAFGRNANDVPFALIYVWDESTRRVELAACSEELASGRAFEELAVIARRSMVSGAPTQITDAATLVGGTNAGPWPEPPRSVFVVPLGRPGASEVSGAVVFGLSPRLVFTDAYRNFLEVAASQVAAAISSSRAVQEVRRRADALAAIDRAKTAFFSNVSHEFRTPLTLLLGPTEELLSGAHGELPAAQRAQLELLRRNALRLQRLVNALLEFSRVEAGRVQATFRPTDLAGITRDLASAFRAAIEKAGIEFSVDCPPLDEPVFVDADMWEQIVMNLLSNAFKFTFEGRIRLSLRSIGASIVLEVVDTGVGVKAEELPRLFERFHRVEGSRARTHEGSGIGLALVQELARLHGGTVEAESAHGVGSAFRVTIPRGFAHLPEERVARDPADVAPRLSASFVEEAARWVDLNDPGEGRSPQSGSTSVGSARAADRRARVLVADDNADMRDYLRRILGAHWLVETVADGHAALEAVRERSPNLVLIDAMMPNLDGFAVLRAIRSDPEKRATPVIMLSARSGEEARVEGLEAGADDYLVKPFSARELVARIAGNLESARLRRLLDVERARLSTLFEKSPAAMCLLKGPDHVYEIANPPYLRTVGDRNVIGLPIRDALPELAGQGYFEFLDDVYRTGEPAFGSEATVMLDNRGDGQLEEHFFNYAYLPNHGPDGGIDGVLVFAFDVTEQVNARRHVEQERRASELARTTAESAVRARDEFLTLVSHELRTPLTTLGLQIDGLLAHLEHTPEGRHDDAKLRHRAARVRAQADRLEHLVEDLISTFELDRHPIDLRPEDVDLAEIVRQVIARLDRRATGNDVRIEFSGAPSVGHWDRRRLEQVVDQLLANALKFGCGHPIHVLLESDARTARLSVADRGIGIREGDQDRIFGRFERATSANNYGGFGLGLWVVRQLVGAMRGTVNVHSAPDRGSTFVVELPRGS